MNKNKKIRVISTTGESQAIEPLNPIVKITPENPKMAKLTDNEIRARMIKKYATTTSFRSRFGAMDTIDSMSSNFFSPQLSTDFLEKPQNQRERRAFCRFFYMTNEIVKRAIDIHTTLPLSKLRLVPPTGSNPHQNKYVMKFFENMCDEMKLFRCLIDVTHEVNLFGNCCAVFSQIDTQEGPKYIKDIVIGDLVLTNKRHYKKVLRTHKRISENILIIKCWNGKELQLTDEHPVEVLKNNKFIFVEAKDLTTKDFIRVIYASDGGDHIGLDKRYYKQTGVDIAFKIRSISEESYSDFVYNLEVEDDHTFIVNGFSTHNCFMFIEEDDPYQNMEPSEIASKKEEIRQRSEFLKNKYKIIDRDPSFKGWKKLTVLPPDNVVIRKLPLSDDMAVEFNPDSKTRELIVQGGYSYEGKDGAIKKYDMPQELQNRVRQGGPIPLDTDPNTGSFCYHLANRKSQYEAYGVSQIECCVNTLLLMDKLRQAQTSIASRHMTPMRVIWAPGLSDGDVDYLREQIDMALVDPDYSVISNYEINWNEMGANGRLLDIEAENQAGLDRLLSGLGITKEILTGEGSYSGSKISLEIMNTQYLLYRELLQDFVENYLFKPVAKKKGFVDYDEYGNEIYLYPKLSFTRLAIRDNDQFFDAVFQLYQKGSVSVDLLLDILNIDPISTKEKLEKDLFTVNDSMFNELQRNVYSTAAQALVDQSDVVGKLADYLGLTIKPAEEAAPEENPNKRFSSVQPSAQASNVMKLAKIMQHFKEHPDLLDKVFENVNKSKPAT